METKTRWHSCRLAPYGDSGRVRWCVGHERAWRIKLKILIFVPILLLSITIIAILLSQIHNFRHSDATPTTKPARSSFQDSENINSDERDVLYDIKTSFIPADDVPLGSSQQPSHRRKKRDIREISAADILFPQKTNDTDDDYTLPYNKSEDFEDVQYSSGKHLDWSAADAESQMTGEKTYHSIMEMDDNPTIDQHHSSDRHNILQRKVNVAEEVRKSQGIL